MSEGKVEARRRAFGVALRKFRTESARLTQRELGFILDVSSTVVSDIEGGRRAPLSPGAVLRLVNKYGIAAYVLRAAAGYCAHCWGTGLSPPTDS